MLNAAMLVMTCTASASLAAGEDFANARVSIEAKQPEAAAPAAETAPAKVELDAPAAAVRFGQAESKWWSIGAGIANNGSDETDLNGYGSLSYFIADDVEVSGELGLWYYGLQEDVFGINPNMVFRWHFLNKGKWTLYADLGIGVMFSTDDVPDDGTSFNFTPRAGGGFTRQILDSGARVQVGVRWAHISNARIGGDQNNPSRDSIMLYAGMIFPF